MLRKAFLVTLAAPMISACAIAQADVALPDGFEPADYVPDNPAPQLPSGVSHDDILWRDGCYYILQGGQPVLLPFSETNPATGAVTQYDRYCIG